MAYAIYASRLQRLRKSGIRQMVMSKQNEILRIEATVRAAGLSVAEFCRRAKIDVSTWQRWKTGARSPRDSTWRRIARAAARAERGSI